MHLVPVSTRSMIGHALKDLIGELPFEVKLVERIERPDDSKFRVYRTVQSLVPGCLSTQRPQ
jgi:hypothetical protein